MCGVRLKGSDGTKLEGQVQLHDAAPKFACDELYRSTRAHAHTHKCCFPAPFPAVLKSFF